MKRNILLFILVLVLCLVLAPYFGNWYNLIDHQYGGWITGEKGAVVFVGFILAYVFLTPLIFKLFGKNNQNKLIGWLVSPVFLLYAGYNWKLLYIPILTAITGFLLAKIINFIISKIKHPQLR